MALQNITNMPPQNIQNCVYSYATDTGTANAYVVNLSPAITTLVAGLELGFIVGNTNTGSSTLTINSNAAKAIVVNLNVALNGGELVTGMLAKVKYNGTNFVLLNPAILGFRDENVFVAGDFSTNPMNFGNGVLGIVGTGTTQIFNMWKWIQTGTGNLNVEPYLAPAPVSVGGSLATKALEITPSTAVTLGTSADYYLARSYIEGYDFLRIAQIPFTISFQVRSTITGQYCIALRNSGSDRSIILPYTITATNTWQNVVLNVPASPSAGTWNYTNGLGLEILVVVAAGSNYNAPSTNQWVIGNYFSFSGQVNGLNSNSCAFIIQKIKIQPGYIATPYTEEPYEIQRSKYDRYFYSTYIDGVVAGTSNQFANAQVILVQQTNTNIAMGTLTYPRGRTNSGTITIYSPNSGTSGTVYNVNTSSDIVCATINNGDRRSEIYNNSGTLIAGLTDTRVHFTVNNEL